MRTYYPDGHIPETGELFRQPNLARTLRAIAEADRAEFERSKNHKRAVEAGRDIFYKGDIAKRIAAAVEKDGGLLRYSDLAGYRGRIEEPVISSFYGYEICKGGFWSQGPALLMLLNILEAADIRRMQIGSEQYLHTLAESIKLAFDDRNAFFGDPDFSKVPMEGLLSKAYAAERARLSAPGPR